MAETNPVAPGVAPAAPSVTDRMAAFLDQPEESAAPAEAEEQPASPEPTETAPAEATPQESDELSPEDIPDDAAPVQPTVGDEFEIVHNGTQHKLPRAEVIKLAQQGFDYTQKTQALAEKVKTFDTTMQRVAELEQVLPLIAQEQAQVAAFRAQLAPYEKVDWVQLATDNPLDYPKYRAQYDILVSQHNQAAQRVAQAYTEFQRQLTEAKQQRLTEEFTKLQTMIPEWKQPEKYRAGAQELQSYLLAQGADAQSPLLQSVLGDAVAITLARKAMLYDKAMKSKGEKAKLLQTVPPVARPGVHPSREAANADQQTALRAKLKKSGDVKDAAALFATYLK